MISITLECDMRQLRLTSCLWHGVGDHVRTLSTGLAVYRIQATLGVAPTAQSLPYPSSFTVTSLWLLCVSSKLSKVFWLFLVMSHGILPTIGLIRYLHFAEGATCA